VTGRTQAALYAEIDLELSWSEAALPQVERTKHVHALHPYLGKFIPQLVEVFLRRHFRAGECVFDPFAGSGTTLVEANVYGCDAVGADISAFNCLLTRVKTARHSLAALDLALRGTLERARLHPPEGAESTTWLETWYSPRALGELLSYRSAIEELDSDAADVARVVLSRAARSARLTPHFDLDFPRTPMRTPYWCLKHKRTCRPVDEAQKFLRRYSADTMRRLHAFASVRTERTIEVVHGDARAVEVGRLRPAGIITSPPYPGLIDYHEQHRYAYELLQLEDRRSAEIGAGARGTSRGALEEYVVGMTAAFRRAEALLQPGAPVVIVVNDSRRLYPQILARAGLVLEERLRRHVNRRTGRRAGEFFEDVLVCTTARPLKV